MDVIHGGQATERRPDYAEESQSVGAEGTQTGFDDDEERIQAIQHVSSEGSFNTLDQMCLTYCRVKNKFAPWQPVAAPR